jgi:hypothetical protein
MKNDNLMRNGSGYVDPTAYTAIMRADGSNKELHKERVNAFHTLLDIIHDLCRLCDFELEEHVILKDKITGKIWR